MLILAIDPGPENSAYCIYESKRRGKIFQKDITANKNIRALLKEEPPSIVAIEMIASYGMPVGYEVFATCVEIGRFIECFNNEQNIHQLTRKEIVTHLCGKAKASDANVRQALIDRFGGKGTKKNPGILYGVKKDIWSALAIAVTFADLHPY